jgi:opine dehydrogenase
MAPFLRDGQIVVLNPGRTGGALEFAETIRRSGSPARPVLCEAQTFIYASRALSRFEARIFRIKDSVALASLPPSTCAGRLDALSPAFHTQFRPVARSWPPPENNGGVFQPPASTIMNAS